MSHAARRSLLFVDIDARAGQEPGLQAVGRGVQVGGVLRAPAAHGQQGDPPPRGLRRQVHVHLQGLYHRRVSGHKRGSAHCDRKHCRVSWTGDMQASSTILRIDAQIASSLQSEVAEEARVPHDNENGAEILQSEFAGEASVPHGAGNRHSISFIIAERLQQNISKSNPKTKIMRSELTQEADVPCQIEDRSRKGKVGEHSMTIGVNSWRIRRPGKD